MKTRGLDWIGAGFCSLVLALSGAGAEGPELGDGDRPVRIVEQAKVEFPRTLRAIGVTTGQVRLFLRVDADGTLGDHLFVAFTHYEFANAVSQAVARWRYEPARVGGRAIASTVGLTVRFETTGMVVTERRSPAEAERAWPDGMFRARELAELDEVPRVVFSVEPPVPVGDDATAICGRVRVEFYIDENGDVRMPVVATADDERLGWAAVAAIAKWQFEVPRRGGHPVLARASQVFVFSPEE